MSSLSSMCTMFLSLTYLIFFNGYLALTVTAVSPAELSALNDIYNSANGYAWAWRPPIFQQGAVWDFTPSNGEPPDPCAESWQGVTCGGGVFNSFITGLRLTRYNLTGTMPESLCNLTRLENLELQINRMYGSIPSRIGDLQGLTNLDLNNNFLTSSIPVGVGNLTTLQSLWLYYNSISGSIPETIGHLHLLTMLELDSNSLTGGIPSSIGQMTSLDSIYLYDNRLSNSIPSEIGLLQNLVKFVVFSNAFTGSLPSSLTQCTSLEELLLNVNKFTGSIPEDIGDLSLLVNLYLYETFVTGTIPSSVSKLENLVVLGLSNNLLEGSLPDDIGVLGKLEILDISFNFLTGMVPTLANLTSLEYLMLHVNQLSGTIPNDVAQLTTLVIVDMIGNDLTGTVPSGWGVDMVNLQFLLLGENMLTGTLPASYLCLPAVVQLELRINLLSGPLTMCNDSALLSSSLLGTLDLSSNLFQGTIPPTMGSFQHLHYLILSDNQLDGPLDNLYNVSQQAVLSVIDVSDNFFSGSIPEAFFLGYLEVFSASTNCLRGDLPVSLCNATSLITFGVDGGGAASTCPNNQGFQLSTPATITNGLLPCLFNLPALTTLHLSGSGITGSLPPFGPNMSIKDLVLGYNELTGTIPTQYQARGFDVLDLSHNALAGTLSASLLAIPVNGSLQLLGNLLSGEIPNTIKHTHDISILKGSIFTCNIQRQSLPVQDEYRDSYSCGSALANGALIVWVIFAFLVMAVCWRTWWVYSAEVAASSAEGLSSATVVVTSVVRWKQWYSAFFDETQHTRYSSLIVYLEDIERLCVGFVCYLTFVLLPVFSTLTYHFHTYTYQYAWTVSAVLNSGYVPAVVMVVIWWTLIGGYCLHSLIRWHKTQRTAFSLPFRKKKKIQTKLLSPSSSSSSSSSLSPAALPSISLSSQAPTPLLPAPLSPKPSRSSTVPDRSPQLNISKQYIKLIRISAYTLALLLNITVVGGLNAAYVYFFFNYDSLDYTSLRFAQVIFAAFKVLWSMKVVPSMLHRVRHRIHVLVHKEGMVAVEENAHGIEFQTFIVLLNNIAIPMVAAALFSSHCFYDAVVAPPSVDVKYSFLSCQTFTLEGELLSCATTYMKPQSTSYHPSFSYDYSCSSDLIMEYVPIFLFMFVIVAVVVPTLQILASVVHIDNTTTRRSEHDHKMRTHSKPKNTSTMWRYFFSGCGVFSSKTIKTLNLIHRMHSPAEEWSVASSPIPTTIFHSDFFCVTILQHCAVILTFGVHFPLLGICGCIAVWVLVQSTRLDLGRVHLELQELRSVAAARPGRGGGGGGDRGRDSLNTSVLVDTYQKILATDCQKVQKFKDSALWLIVVYATLFNIVCTTDTLGRDVSWGALLVLIAFICLAPLLARGGLCVGVHFLPSAK